MQFESKRKGLMLVLSSPSGAGKTSLAKEVLANDDQIQLSISVTTRKPRKSEQDGKDYYFISEEKFFEMKERGELLESAHVFDHYYGTPKNLVINRLEQGKDVLFDIDWQGTQLISDLYDTYMVKIFILPPSAKELRKRLLQRNQDSEEIVEKRMQRAYDEMRHYSAYDWVIINDNFEKSVEDIRAILRSERLRRSRQIGLAQLEESVRYGKQ